MPTFDPTKPATGSPVSSAELRDHFNALEAEIEGTAYDPVDAQSSSSRSA